MVVLSSAVCAAAFVCSLRVLVRGEVFKAGMFLLITVICVMWASTLHVTDMQELVPGPLMAIGILTFCMCCGRHETFIWNWLLSPFGQALGGGMAFAGFIMQQFCFVW